MHRLSPTLVPFFQLIYPFFQLFVLKIPAAFHLTAAILILSFLH